MVFFRPGFSHLCGGVKSRNLTIMDMHTENLSLYVDTEVYQDVREGRIKAEYRHIVCREGRAPSNAYWFRRSCTLVGGSVLRDYAWVSSTHMDQAGTNFCIKKQPTRHSKWLILDNRLNRLQTVCKLFATPGILNGNENGYNHLKTFTNGNGWSLRTRPAPSMSYFS
jgi:hypothetical protein